MPGTRVCIQDWPICSKRSLLLVAAAHPIQILRNNRMIGLRQRKPVERLVAVVARGRSHSQPDLCPITLPDCAMFRQVSNDHIGPGHQRWCLRDRLRCCKGGMTTDLRFAVDNCLISIGCIAAPMEIFPAVCTGVRWTTQVRWQTVLI